MKKNNVIKIVVVALITICLLFFLFFGLYKKLKKDEYIYLANGLSISSKDIEEYKNIEDIVEIIDIKIFKDKYGELESEYNNWCKNKISQIINLHGSENLNNMIKFYFGYENENDFIANSYYEFMKEYLLKDKYISSLKETEKEEIIKLYSRKLTIKYIKIEPNFNEEESTDGYQEKVKLMQAKAKSILEELNFTNDFLQLYNEFVTNDNDSENYIISLGVLSDEELENNVEINNFFDIYQLEENEYVSNVESNSYPAYIIYCDSSNLVEDYNEEEILSLALDKILIENFNSENYKKLLLSLREEYELKINDKELKEKYEEYIKEN